MFYLEDCLASVNCGNPACAHPHAGVFLNRCHPAASSRLLLDPHRGRVVVLCVECGTPHAAFALARRPTVESVLPSPDMATAN